MDNNSLSSLSNFDLFRLVLEKFGIEVKDENDIAGAWLVVEKLQERGWYFVISTDDPYDVTFSVDVRDSRHGTWDTNGTYDKWITVDTRDTTAPLAICRAALMAAEAE